MPGRQNCVYLHVNPVSTMVMPGPVSPELLLLISFRIQNECDRRGPTVRFNGTKLFGMARINIFFTPVLFGTVYKAVLYTLCAKGIRQPY